jgi:hypothetical protein
MKQLLSIFALLLFVGCSIQKNLPDETQYLTLNEIKRDYQLTNKQCKQIERTDTIKSKYFGAIDVRVYDAKEDYSVFKK